MSGGYDVGKGKPPQNSQFKPGQSGNAKGRPRKAKPAAVTADSEFDKTLRERFDTPVSVKDGGKTKQVPMSEAVISSTLAVAAKGNPLAQRTALTLLQELELREAARQLAEEELDRKTVDHVRQVKAVQTKAWAEAEARGEKPARLYPHPADIFISHDGLQWRCKGPWHVNEVPRFELYMTLCEIAYLRWFYSDKLLGKQHRETVISHALILPYYLLIPFSWQDRLSTEWFSRWAWLTNRQLRSELIECEGRAATAQLVLDALNPLNSQSQKELETALRPMLTHCGYKSLKELDQAAAAERAARPARFQGLPDSIASIEAYAEVLQAERNAKAVARRASAAKRQLPSRPKRSTVQ